MTELTRKQFLQLSLGAAAGLALPFPADAQGAQILRKIPKSGERLPVVGLGTAQSFGYADDAATFAKRVDVIRTLLDGGGKVIDTSPTYGAAEDVVGRALARLGRRADAFIATKISTYGLREGIDQHAQSVKDLRTPKFDLLQIHNLKDTELHLKTVRRLKAEGRVRLIGVTHFRTRAFDGLADVMEKEPLDFVQLNYSLAQRDAERRLLPLARDKGIATLINVPFARGRLFGRVRGRKLPPWAAEFDARSWGQFFLKYILANAAVTAVIPGTTKVRHMTDNLGAGRGRLPTKAQRKRMVELIADL